MGLINKQRLYALAGFSLGALAALGTWQLTRRYLARQRAFDTRLRQLPNAARWQSAAAFDKRFYTSPHRLIAALRDFSDHADDLSGLRRRGLVSRDFAERIMLAVTAVNGCRYCSFAHTRWAMESGIAPEELEGLLGGEIGHVPPEETPALLFAQHYAESADRPDPQMIEKLIKTYGPEKARDIMAYIRMITMGNLAGNTFEAFFSRLRGAPAPDSKLLKELATITFMICGTIPFGIAMMIKRKWQQTRRR